MSQKINTPKNVSDITPAWASQILKTKISEKEEDFIIFTNVHAGSGFLSNMIRLHCKSFESEKSYNLIIKLLPQDPKMKSIVETLSLDINELNFYETVSPDLVKILPELQGYVCAFHYGNFQPADPELGIEYASVLVLEDLKPQGYYTINFAGETSKEQMTELISFMAKFHFASDALEDREKVPLKKYYPFLGNTKLDILGEFSLFPTLAREGCPILDKFFVEYNASQENRQAYQKLAPYVDKALKVLDNASKEFPSLIHGDLWSNNLLFNDHPDFHTKVIDWQLLSYKDACYDLAVTIVSCLPQRKLSREAVEEQLQLYFNTYQELCTKTGVPHLLKRDFKTFSKFFYTYAMGYTLFWFLMGGEPCPFAASIPKLIRIHEFLAIDLNIVDFLIDECNKQ